jgi:hypothetical protein
MARSPAWRFRASGRYGNRQPDTEVTLTAVRKLDPARLPDVYLLGHLRRTPTQRMIEAPHFVAELPSETGLVRNLTQVRPRSPAKFIVGFEGVFDDRTILHAVAEHIATDFRLSRWVQRSGLPKASPG